MTTTTKTTTKAPIRHRMTGFDTTLDRLPMLTTAAMAAYKSCPAHVVKPATHKAAPAPTVKGGKAKATSTKGGKAMDTGAINGGKAMSVAYPMLTRDDKGETYSKASGGTYRYPARSAGTVINDAMAKAGKAGVTLADLVKAITDNDPSKYAGNPGKAMDKVVDHAVTWLSRTVKAGTWQRKGDHYICTDAKAACINYRCSR